MQHILVCDDEKDIVAALKIYLESDGYCVHTAYSGEEALRKDGAGAAGADGYHDARHGRHHGHGEAARVLQYSRDFAHGKIRGFGQNSGPQRGRGRLYHEAL